MVSRVLAVLLLLCGVAQAQIYSPGAANLGGLGPICPGMGALCAPVPVVVGCATTWDSGSRLLNVTLSGGNLKATTTASSNAGARSTTSHSTGKWYYEWTFNAGSNTFEGVGLQLSTYDPSTASNIIGFESPTKSVQMVVTGTLEAGSSGIATWGAAAMVNGDTAGVAVDIGGLLLWGRIRHSGSWGNWNNNGSADPATGTLGITIPNPPGAGTYFIGFGSNTANEAITLDPTGAIGPAPSGFSTCF